MRILPAASSAARTRTGTRMGSLWAGIFSQRAGIPSSSARTASSSCLTPPRIARIRSESSHVQWLRGRIGGDDGSMLVEFVVLAVALLIPCMYLALTLGSVQGAFFAADAIARDAARYYATQPDPATAQTMSESHAALIAEDFGISAAPAVETVCSHDPCATPGGTVQTTVTITVPIPGLGPMLGGDGPIQVSSEHALTVDQYRAFGHDSD